ICPDSDHRKEAEGNIEVLTKMVAEDQEHAKSAKPIEAMTVEEQVQEWIFRLCDQNGHQYSQPGTCDIFAVEGLRAGDDGSSPAHQLAKLGFAAVPSLIAALDDTRPSRSVEYGRDFFYSHTTVTVGGCAEAVLARIASRRSWEEG